MASLPIRNQTDDHLLTPRNCAPIVIDYQPIQIASIASMDRRDLVMNIVAVARAAKLYGVPIVLSTVNVKTGANQPTIHQIASVLEGIEALDPRLSLRRAKTAYPGPIPAKSLDL
jgi:nicotinamidase-related amidase